VIVKVVQGRRVNAQLLSCINLSVGGMMFIIKKIIDRKYEIYRTPGFYWGIPIRKGVLIGRWFFCVTLKNFSQYWERD
jgi:hypothetical protein